MTGAPTFAAQRQLGSALGGLQSAIDPDLLGTPQQPQRRAGATGNGSTSTAAGVIPSIIQVGDLMVLVVTYKLTVGTGTINTPSGWTPLGSIVALTGAVGQGARFTKVATAADVGATLTVTASAGSQQINWVLGAYYSNSGTVGANGFVDLGGSSSTSVVCASQSAGANALRLLVGSTRGASNGQYTFTPPAGYTLRNQVVGVAGAAQDIATFLADGFASGAQTVTSSIAVWAIAGEIVLEVTAAAAVADTTTVSDSAASAVTLQSARSEGTTVADASSSVVAAFRANAETTTVADTASQRISVMTTAADSIAIADIAAARSSLTATRAETVGVSDGQSSSVLLVTSRAETTGLADAAVNTIAVGRNRAETTTIADGAASTTGRAAAISDTTSIADAADTSRGSVTAHLETTTVIDSAATSFAGIRIIVRPSTGAVTRPHAGTVTRPAAGSVVRPNSGYVIRPRIGLVDRP